MCEQKPTAQHAADSDYGEWVKDLCLDDLTPEEFEALGRELRKGPATTATNKTFQSNPDPCPGNENLGHTEGFTKDGTYYEAELWVWEEELCVSFLLNEKWEFAPESEFLAERAEKEAVASGEIERQPGHCDRSELIQGMLIRKDQLSHEEAARYVEYLVGMGLVEFLTNVYNGVAVALTDVCGNDVVQCLITLESAGNGAGAITPLHFSSFESRTTLTGSDFKVVACGKTSTDQNDNEDMTDLERIEFDAEYGYFQEEEQGEPKRPHSEPNPSSGGLSDKYDQAFACTTGHREEVRDSEWCSCLSCGRTFPPSFIYRWIDDGQTPVCPYCGVDMVFGHDSVDFPVDEFFAKALGTYGETQTI